VEAVTLQVDRGEFGVGDFDFGGVRVFVELGVDLQAGGGGITPKGK